MAKKDFTRPEIVVFDVYETLLDMSEIERKINALTESKRGYIIWFEIFMQYCFLNNSLDTFYDFTSIAKATLQMTGQKLGRSISEEEVSDVLTLLKRLPIHEEVQTGLSKLSDKGYRIAALTNVPEKVVCERMERTGLISYFEKVLSAESVKKYKPEKSVYEWAASKLNTACSHIMMVTAHIWDIAGAANAGMKTAFLERDKQLFYPLTPRPDIVCHTIPELASLLEEETQGFPIL